MSWRVFLADRQGQLDQLLPVSLSWNALGGPDKAVLRLSGSSLGLTGLKSWLGAGVEIFDASDRLAWWGYVDQVGLPAGKNCLEASLGGMANRLAVRYDSIESGTGFASTVQTPWLDDLPSQAVYGIKEILLRRGTLSSEQALLLRDSSLRRLAQPADRLSADGAGRGQIVCRGWLERLRWRQWPEHSDLNGHCAVQVGSQTVGASLKQKILAQSFTVKGSVKFVSVGIRARKIGAPTDHLRLQIQADSSGLPSGTVLAEAVLLPDAISGESYTWLSAWFAEPCVFAEGEKLWLVISRDGAVSSTAHFSLGVDENLGFAEGKLMIYDSSASQWKARSSDADLLFRLMTLSNSAFLLGEAAQISEWITGFSYEAGAGFDLPYVSASGEDCLQAFTELLSLGSPDLASLTAEVTPQRRLRVLPRPSFGMPRYHLGADGKLREKSGALLEPCWQAVGCWVGSDSGVQCFLENLNLNIISGTIRLCTSDGIS